MKKYMFGESIKFKSVLARVDKSDKYILLGLVLLLASLRVVLSGSDIPYLRRVPSVFRYYLRKYKLCDPKKISKMSESLWYGFYHSFSLLWGVRTLMIEYGTPEKPGWLMYLMKDLDAIWYLVKDMDDFNNKIIGWPFLEISTNVRLWYLTATAFWISSIFFVNWETRRTDTKVMKFHHITTTSLLLISHLYNYHRLGVVILFLHDISDVILYWGKSYIYSPFLKPVVIAIMFFIYMGSHLVARFILLFRYIVYPAVFNFDISDFSGGEIKRFYEFPVTVFPSILIVLLIIMNTYWFHAIIMIAKKLVLENEVVCKLTSSQSFSADTRDLD